MSIVSTVTAIIILMSVCNVNDAVVSQSYSYCSPDGMKHLWCEKQHYCRQKYQYSEDCITQCFACHARTGWDISLPNITYLPLDIEPLNVEETNIVILSRYTPNNRTYYYLKYTNRRLERIPDDLRLYRIVHVDLTGNMIREIGNITHLQDLDTLVLRHNLLTHVSNRTFVNMPYLRVVDLSCNNIITLDHNILQGPNTNILSLNLSGNYFKVLDVSNIFVPNRTICGTKYSDNKNPLGFTNNNKWLVDTDNIYIRGDTEFSSVKFTRHPTLLILKNIKFGYKYFLCGQNTWRATGYKCDCEMADVFELILYKSNEFFGSLINEGSYCSSPEKLKNNKLRDLFLNKSAHSLLSCDLVDGCPIVGNCQCTCTLKPVLGHNNTATLFIDCSKSMIMCTDFPKIVPDRKNGILLNVSGQAIRSLNTKYYFDKIEVLDLTSNPIESIDKNINALAQATQIIMPHHMLQTLPKEIRSLNPKIFSFGQNGIPCNCDNVWIGEWRSIHISSELPPLYCSNYDGVLIEHFIINLADCDAFNSSYLKLFCLCVPLLVFCIIWRFRYLKYDFAIFKRKLSYGEKYKPTVWEIDVYLSFDDDNDDVRYFVLWELDSFFRRHSISCYIPSRDAWPGYTEEHNIKTNMTRSKYCIVIQSEGMYDSTNKFTYSRRMEYKLAYDMYVKKQLDKIIILNFDILRPEPFQYFKSQSLFRHGLGFTIFDRKISLYKSLLKVLDEPLVTILKHRFQVKKKLKAALWRKTVYQT